jgi:hypothetical protein
MQLQFNRSVNYRGVMTAAVTQAIAKDMDTKGRATRPVFVRTYFRPKFSTPSSNRLVQTVALCLLVFLPRAIQRDFIFAIPQWGCHRVPLQLILETFPDSSHDLPFNFDQHVID